MLHVRLAKDKRQIRPRWGASTAQSDLELLRPLWTTRELSEGVILDFEGISAVNASYVRASVAWVIRCGMLHHLNSSGYHLSLEDPWAIRPIEIGGCYVMNLTADVREEIESVLNQPGFRLACFEVTEWKKPSTIKLARVLGHLDEQLKQCLLKLYALGGTGMAADLHARYHDEGVQITAWNNRLAGLYERLLLRRKKSGRNFIYHTLSKEIEFNGLLLSAA